MPPADVVAAHPQHADAIRRGARCHECPLFGCGRGPVPGDVKVDSPVAYVGEAPGNNEVLRGRVFVGASGHILDRATDVGGIPRARATVINTQECQPPDGLSLKQHEDRLTRAWKTAGAKAKVEGRKPPPQPLLPRQACLPRLKYDLTVAGSKVLCAVGGAALEALAAYCNVGFARRRAPIGAPTNEFGRPLRVMTIKKQHGSPLILPDGRVLMASFHPAYAMRGEKRMRGVIEADLARAARIAARDGAIEWSRPEFIVEPSIEQAIRFIRFLRVSGARVTLDLETDAKNPLKAHIRCVGLGAVVEGREHAGVIPIRRINGRLWYPAEDTRRLVDELRALFASSLLAGHNVIGYDSTVMLQRGLMTNRNKSFFDTLIGDHDTDRSELPHDLGFVVAREFEAPRHKEDADAKYMDGVSDRELHVYCCQDVLTTLRLVPRIADRIVNTDMVLPFRSDTRLALIARDMGALGLCVDLKRRAALYEQSITTLRARLHKLRDIVDDQKFNPNSTAQVARFLYDVKGYVPALTTDGDEWEEGDKASTGETALVRLLDLGVDTQTRAFIDAQLEFRGASKLIGTYINGPARGMGSEEDDDEDEVREVPPLLDFPLEHVDGMPEPLPMFHVSWRVHVVPTGRLSSSPNAQNVPISPINMRSMFVAPPGHVFVGADFSQIELRLYAMFAHDRLLLDAFKTGSDPHAWNFACMMTGGDLTRAANVYRQMMAAGKGHPKVKHLRTVAKRFCLAEGTPVLTDRGAVPIERVTRDDRVWDGVEWVSHDGVVCQGVKDVIEHDGLCATPDHLVWLPDGRKVQFGYAALLDLPLAVGAVDGVAVAFDAEYGSVSVHGAEGAAVQTRTTHHDWGGNREGNTLDVGYPAGGRGHVTGSRTRRDEVRGVDDSQLCVAARAVPVHSCAVCGRELRGPQGCTVRQPRGGEIKGLSHLREHEIDAALAAESHECRATAVPESEQRSVRLLRWARDQIQVQERRSGGSVGAEEPRRAPRSVYRQDRQRRALRAGESTLGQCLHAYRKQAKCCSTCWVEVQRARVAISPRSRSPVDLCGPDPRGDHRVRAKVHRGAETKMAGGPAAARVYDILNAGPRRRFTASGKILSNCFLLIYGGEPPRLYATMSTERNPDGSRAFPGITFDDIRKWHNGWHASHPETKQWQGRVRQGWREYGSVATLLTRRKRFFIGGFDRNAIVNHPIQGGAADIMTRGFLAVSDQIPYRGWSPMSGPVLQVHDYGGWFVPLDRAQEALKIVEAEMPYVHEGMDFPIEAGISSDWGRQ